MDPIVYSQVQITCTTINLLLFVFWVSLIVHDAIHERREKKKKEKEEQKSARTE